MMGLWWMHCLTLLAAGISLLVEVHGQTCTGYGGVCECTERLGRKTVVCDRTALQSAEYEVIVAQLPTDIVELKFNAGKQSTLRNGTFSSLTQLEKLVVERCDIDTVEMDAFGRLSSLKELHLVTAEFTKLPDFVFKDLQSLEKLHLFENFIDELSPDVFSGLNNLKTLDLSSNVLISLPEDVFSHLPRLERLILSGNQLQSLPSTIFHRSTALTYVALSDNKLTEIHPDTFNSSVVLEEVHFEKNQLTTMSGAVFARNSQIQLVNLEGNAFICDCTMADFKLWSITAGLSWNAVQSGTCNSPEELKHKNLLNVDPSQLICTTTTTTTTTPSTTTTFLPSTTETEYGVKGPSTPGEVSKGLDDMTKYIIIACCVGGAFLIALTIAIVVCCCKRSKKKPRQVKYILKPKTEDEIGKNKQYALDDLNRKLALDSKISQDEVDDFVLPTSPNLKDNSYRPNIMPTETDLDEDIRFSYENEMYNNQPGEGGNEDMRFYNSLSRSIAGASIGRERVTPLSTLHRATPVNRAMHGTPTLPSYPPTHQATPLSPYKMADNHPQSPWKENSPYDYAPYLPPTAYSSRVAPADICNETAYPVYYSNAYVAENDCNGKYSTGSADSGVHSNSPAPRPRTPTDFSDHRISPNDPIGSQNSINKKTIKNETYV